MAMRFVHAQDRISVHSPNDTIPMKVDSLKAAIVTAVVRPRMKGDTLEYNVEHMAMRPNTVVEELLRRLPGLQVDANGNITYNGQKIEHLLVDGQDIFGSNPTMVTRNFDASKIALVQILDRKNDDAIFTGIDDGSRTKTLNLVLKDGARNGYFGKVEASGNFNHYYSADGALAAFRNKEQFTAIGMTANTGDLSSSTDGAEIGFLYGISDPLGASAGMGIPIYNAAALHYANNWGTVGNQVQCNYQYSHFFTRPFTNTQSIQIESDSLYGQIQQSQSLNNSNLHWVDLSYECALDNRSGFRLKFRGTNTQQQNQFNAIGNSTFNDTLVNSSERSIHDRMSQEELGGEIAWRTRIGQQANRIFSMIAAMSKMNETTKGYLYSLEQFYQPNAILQSIDTVDQRKRIISHALSTNLSINYAQPLWRGVTLGVTYGLNLNTDQPLQETYERGDGNYTEVVDTLSIYLKTQTVNQHVSFNLQGKSAHFSYTLGNNWLVYSYRQQDLISDSFILEKYANWAPHVSLKYLPNKGLNVGFHYVSATLEPAISQLAPIKNNNNPLLITIGNPALKPGLNETFGLDFRRFSTWLFSLNLDMTLTSNSISTKITTDSLGRQITQPVNVNGGKKGEFELFLGKKIHGFDVEFQFAGTYAQALNYINADLSQNDSYNVDWGIKINKYVPDQYNLQINTRFSYFDQVSSVNTTISVHYWAQRHSINLTTWLIPYFEFGTNATYTWQEKTNSFSGSTSVLLWNSHVSRNFLHNKLVVKAEYNNILNQNVGIFRTNSANVNSETSTNILGRIWMLSAIYHFDKQFRHK